MILLKTRAVDRNSENAATVSRDKADKCDSLAEQKRVAVRQKSLALTSFSEFI